jgi:membrane protease YdiL (CAAX protease family)
LPNQPTTSDQPPTANVYLRVGVYILLYILTLYVSAPLIVWIGGYLFGVTLGQFVAAITANWIALRIYGRLRLSDIGLKWNLASTRNLALGIAGGMGAAALVLVPPLAAHIATLAPAPEARASWDVFLFTTVALLAGAAGEEILFRGYGFQVLLRAWGPYTTIFTVAAVFGAMHAMNPNSTWLGVVNTTGFGVLFGYAFLRSGDLWLPIGLHFGWNFTLPLFGVNVSGLTIKLTGRQMEWSAGPVWSGGEYGPEGSVLTSIVLLALALFLWKAPIRTQQSEVFPCVPGSLSSS